MTEAPITIGPSPHMNNPSRIAWVSAFLVAVALFYAPLAYGCTRPDMLPPLYTLLAAAMLTGVISFVVERRWPYIPKLALGCIIVVLAQGWWLTYNPVFLDVVTNSGGLSDTTLTHIHRLSINSMKLTTAMLGTFVLVCGLFGHQTLRRFILFAAALSGALICIIGDALKISGQPLMQYFWNPLDIYWNDFAFYRYQGNAGAFLNLVWPLILVFTRRAYTPIKSSTRKIAWTVFSIACGIALFLNASKAALVVGLLILPWPFLSRLLRLKQKTLGFVVVGALVLIAVGLVVSAHFLQETAFQRMTNTTEVSESFGGRVDAYRQYLNTVPDVGLVGFGPGLFQLAFPYQTSPLGNVSEGLREYAHQDYLQTVIEWGWLGTLCWTLFVGGGLYQAFKCHAQKVLFTSKTERHLILAALLGVIGTLAESLIDFPLQIASIRLFFLVLLALCWVSPLLLSRPREKERIRYRLPIPMDEAEEEEAVTTSSR